MSTTLKKTIAVLTILLAVANSEATEITSQDIEKAIAEQNQTHAVLVASIQAEVVVK